jgi:trimeric autotransporter adhesin
MKKKIGIKLSVPPHSLIQSLTRSACIFTMAAIALIGFSRAAYAVTPAPDGGYAGGNTAEGTSALFSLTTGVNNTALGFQALFADGGNSNTAAGWNALRFNTSANDNTAFGAQALYKNTIGTGNTAMGRNALLLNTTSSANTAVGFEALQLNTAGPNTALGYQALTSNTTGIQNVAIGPIGLSRNTDGNQNNAVGAQALQTNSTGDSNNALGYAALLVNNGSGNTAVGDFAGANLTTGSGNVCIGGAVEGSAGENNTTRIKNIGSTAIVGGTNVVIAGTGGNGDQVLGYASSSRRYKRDIEPMGRSSETLFALKPVTFRPNDGASPSELQLYGLIAEDVEKVSHDLVAYNEHGKVTTVRYESINAMLLNEFLKEHRKVEELQRALAKQQKQIAALTSGLRKVSAELELSKSAPQLVGNSR